MRKFLPITFLLLSTQFCPAQEMSDSDTITSPQFNEGVISDPLQLILGKDPGAEVFKAGSDPTVPSSLMIRGMTGLLNGSHPLYVIDGITGGDLFMVPPQEIESVRILKNIAETSLYGTEGTPGVVLVTTRSGSKTRRLTIDFNTAVSLGQTTGRLDLFSAQQMRDKAIAHPEINFTDGGGDTDWQDEIYRTTVSQSYQLGLGGTLKNTSYRLSFDHVDQPGNVRGTGRKITGGSVRLLQTAFKKKLQVEGLFSYYQSKSEIIRYPLGRTRENPIYQAFIQNPTDPVYMDDGSTYYQGIRSFQYSNPVALINSISTEAETDQLSAQLNARWEIWKGLGINVSGSYIDSKTQSLYDRSEEAFPAAIRVTEKKTNDYSRLNFLAGLTYKRTLGKDHSVDLFAGYILRSYNQDMETKGTYGISSIPYDTLLSQTFSDYSLRAALNYSFRRKYSIGVVINQEHDRTNVERSSYGQTLDWGEQVFYPGVTASWNIGREKFMGNLKMISRLVLSAGYGIAGTRPPTKYISPTNVGYTNGKLEVEKTSEFNTALDLGFLHDRLCAEISYYYRNTPNAIARISQPVPPFIASYSYENGMRVSNTGFEFHFAARVLEKKSIDWTSMLGFSMNRNRVRSTAENTPSKSGYIDYYFYYYDSPYTLTTETGQSLLAFKFPVFTSYSGGEPIYEREGGGYTDYPGQGRMEITDKVFPDCILSWTNSFTLFKSFDASLMFRYVAGHRIFNGTRMYLAVPGNYLHLNTLPEAESNYNDGVVQVPFSDMYLENASYLRLENLCIGYTYLPKNMKWKGRLRVYLAVSNLFTITGYSGLDPAFNYNSAGLDYFNTYPGNRVYTLGLNLEI